MLSFLLPLGLSSVFAAEQQYIGPQEISPDFKSHREQKMALIPRKTLTIRTAKLKVPSQERVNLSLGGEAIRGFHLNAASAQSKVRNVQFVDSSQLDIYLQNPSEILLLPDTNPVKRTALTPTLSDLRKGILFEIKSCVQEDETLTCDVLLTDQRGDREVTIYKSNNQALSRVIDVTSTQLNPNHVGFGGKESRGFVTQPLVQNISLKASLVFTEVQVPGKILPLVEIGVYTREDNFFSAQFRDVPIMGHTEIHSDNCQ